MTNYRIMHKNQSNVSKHNIDIRSKSIGTMLRLLLTTESRARRFLSGELALDSQCDEIVRKSKYSITIRWNNVSNFISKKIK